jgi:hypothetical protein
MPQHNYICAPTRAHWPAGSTSARLGKIPLLNKDGSPVLDDKGNQVTLAAAAWLDLNKPVEMMTWAPGFPMVIQDRLLLDGGWIERPGVATFNLYIPPTAVLGDPAKAEFWIEHVRYIYPEDAEHLFNWFAHRVQRPEEKLNHALVLGGEQGIGKDTILEPVKGAIGRWNFQEASPAQVLEAYNSYVKSVILRISEARDLGDFDRFKFYDHTKSYIAAPPDVLRVNDKYIRHYPIINVCGVIITTNHKTDGIYLPPGDRRHYVAWSDRKIDDPQFQNGYWNDFWGYLYDGGMQHVGAWLMERDLSGFDAKAPPPKTAAFWTIVNTGRSSEVSELADALDSLGNPPAVTLDEIRNAPRVDTEFGYWLSERKNRRVIPHRFEECGYVPVRNDAAKDGLWKYLGTRQVIYAQDSMSYREQLDAVKMLLGDIVVDVEPAYDGSTGIFDTSAVPW